MPSRNNCAMNCGRPVQSKKWGVCLHCYNWMRYHDKRGRTGWTTYRDRLQTATTRSEHYFEVREPSWAQSTTQRRAGRRVA